MGFSRNAEPGPKPAHRVIFSTPRIVCPDGDRLKTVVIEVFENDRGRAIRITEKAGSRFSGVVIPINQDPGADEALCEALENAVDVAFGAVSAVE